MERSIYGRHDGRHSPRMHSQTTSTPFPPVLTQPPAQQIPYSDPFHTTRDPFLRGATQHKRERSNGRDARAWQQQEQQQQQQQRVAQAVATDDRLSTSHSHQHHHHHHNHRHQPTRPLSPPISTYPSTINYYPSQPQYGSHHTSLPFDPSRRTPPGGAVSPVSSHSFPARGAQERARSPPAYQNRPIPPALSPRAPTMSSTQLAPAPRAPSTSFTNNRDTLGHRPAMSLTNILESRDDRVSQDLSHNAPSALQHRTSDPLRPPSPGRARSASMREGYTSRGFRDASPSRVTAFGDRTRIEGDARNDPFFGSPQYRRDPAQTFRTYQPPILEPPPSAHGPNILPGRPSSQPAEYASVRQNDITSGREAHPDHRLPLFRPFGEGQPPMRTEIQNQPELAPFPGSNGSAHTDRQIYGSPLGARDRHAHHDVPHLQNGPFSTPTRDDSASLFRPATLPPTSHPTPETPRESIEGRAAEMRHRPLYQSPRPGDGLGYDRLRNSYIERPMTLEDHQRMEAAAQREPLQRNESDSSIHRAILNLSPDLNRKGRNSPLPQAVQGAQHRPVGPGGDHPGIKNEFGRMFSGLGSGVGSATPVGGQSMNGVSTPSRMSPARFGENGDAMRAEVDDIRNGGSVSRAGKRGGRRPREDTDRTAADSLDAADSQRGAKRSKTGHHHHHHHAHPHHHHHHHHHETADPASGAFSMLRFSSNTPAPTHAHHHHHHGHPAHHHHHHPNKSLPLPRKPSITINSKSVLDACANVPRQHLGFQLYTTEVSAPPPPSTPVDASMKYISKPKPIPLFAGKENCTYTIRVPRYYISANGKYSNVNFETICRSRQLWGSDVYTDDSDVVAAAVHSGWLRGDFGTSTLDITQSDQTNGSSAANGDSETGVTKSTAILQTAHVEKTPPPLALPVRPPRPIRVPANHDVHITVLILPPLEAYASTVQNGIHSRDWDTTHDGMSFMVHRIAFVDEAAGTRFIERGAAARKARLAKEEERRREAIEGLVMCRSGTGLSAAPALQTVT